jgi:MFS transporter, SP family, solute carrier family 2 (myo-inositol transporter), member 13
MHSGMRLIERAGRRKLLLSSLVGVVVTLAALVLTFHLSELHAPGVAPAISALANDTCVDPGPSCVTCLQRGCVFCGSAVGDGSRGYCLARFGGADACSRLPVSRRLFVDGCPTPYSALLLLVLMAYLLAFACGMGPVPWAMNAEIYALRFRGAAAGVAGTANWVTNGIVSQTFLLLVHAVKPSGAFAGYAIIAAAAVAWVAVYLPETKGMSMAEVQHVFMRRLRLADMSLGAGRGGNGEEGCLVDEAPLALEPA